jgi:hypothetical protein
LSLTMSFQLRKKKLFIGRKDRDVVSIFDLNEFTTK